MTRCTLRAALGAWLTYGACASLSSESFAWLLNRAFDPPAPNPMRPWIEFSTDAYSALLELISPLSMRKTKNVGEAVKKTCRVFQCSKTQKKQLELLGDGADEESWAFIRWAVQHYASGVTLAERAARHIISQIASNDTCSEVVGTHVISIPKSRNFTMKDAMSTMLQYRRAREDTVAWLERKPDQKSSGTCPQLDSTVRRHTKAFVASLRSLNAHDEDMENGPAQMLSLPVALLEARQARVFNAALESLTKDNLVEVLERKNHAGFSLLQEAALAGASAHALVIRCHARRVGNEEKVLTQRNPAAEEGLAGHSAQEIAAKAGQCAVLDVLVAESERRTGSCPERGDETPSSGMSSRRETLVGVGGWPLETPESALSLSRDCDITSLRFTRETNWSAVLAEQALLEQPLRITGLGQALAEVEPDLFAFGSLGNLCRSPWSDITYEVADIPYASDFRKGEPNVMRLCEYARIVNSTMRSTRRRRKKAAAAPKYWFSEHHPRSSTNRQGDFTVTSSAVHEKLERVRQVVLGALGVKPDPIKMTQLGLGPAWGGAPLHMHATAFNLALMGSRRWLLLPQREGIWSNVAISNWWQSRSQKQMSHMRECMQYPGDVIFVPPYYVHGVLNTAASLVLSWTQIQDYM